MGLEKLKDICPVSLIEANYYFIKFNDGILIYRCLQYYFKI